MLSGKGLACRRGERLVFSDLDFELAEGELLLLRGANGSGKSTLLRLIAGLIQPERGVLSWQGAPITKEDYRAKLAYLGHLDATKPELTPREDLCFWLGVRGKIRAQQAADLTLAHLGLEGLADLPCRLLSAGQRRRLALARILASGAKLWLLDEPFTALDEPAILAVRTMLSQHRASSGLAVMAAHGAALELAPSLELVLGGHAAEEKA
ncbi:MAG TPA: cytochrome c biogenesis heme-transporting ATPase CcmA [Alphaproteobacteria bacterium]|nr:cytochrome c biogenesis heme-transporting ATPase CcmA [Alphaproteobacteria bacterium]